MISLKTHCRRVGPGRRETVRRSGLVFLTTALVAAGISLDPSPGRAGGETHELSNFGRVTSLSTFGGKTSTGAFASSSSATRLFETTNSEVAVGSARLTTVPNLARIASAGGSSFRSLNLQLGNSPERDASATSPNRKAILYSILLPGLAHYDMGRKNRGTAFMVAELAFWTGFAAYRIQGENREESYIEMAELFAGLPTDAKDDDDFYKLIAGWPSSDLYNEIVIRRDARVTHPDDAVAREEYYVANQLRGSETWSWESNAARLRYRDKRNEAQSSFKQSRNMVGLAVANRLVAMIDAVLLSNRLRDSSYGFEIGPDLRSGELTTRVALERRLP